MKFAQHNLGGLHERTDGTINRTDDCTRDCTGNRTGLNFFCTPIRGFGGFSSGSRSL
jgi:hypothetical protein